MDAERMTVPKFRSLKGKRKPVCLTAYDEPTGRLADEAGVDLILVGDSLGNVVLGYENTLPVTMEEMEHHVRATRRGVTRALLVADMPFGSFQASVDHTVECACRLVKAGAEAVKLEGGSSVEKSIRRLTEVGVPVMGHVGMTPQSVHSFGGFRVQGRGEQAEMLMREAMRVQEAGAFSVVLEMVPADVAERITAKLSIPTIGIGAGPGCDGQIQVFHDILNLGRFHPKHARVFADAAQTITEGIRTYAEQVREGTFPSSEESFQ
ncbi:MAG: 3-methyl-2-oxobutanoate hydroxymethyltransferase [Fimbriimonadia bacterium]|jgi:3-methyl-2-oxobutanoate hydroxymethyltransferase